MDVRIDFGATILQETTHVLKIRKDRSTVTGEGRVRCIRKTGTDPCCILVQDKYRKDVAENHSDQYQADAAQNEETTGAQRSKRFPPVKWDDWLTSCRIMRRAHRFHRLLERIRLCARARLRRSGAPAEGRHHALGKEVLRLD